MWLKLAWPILMFWIRFIIPSFCFLTTSAYPICVKLLEPSLEEQRHRFYVFSERLTVIYPSLLTVSGNVIELFRASLWTYDWLDFAKTLNKYLVAPFYLFQCALVIVNTASHVHVLIKLVKYNYYSTFKGYII